MILIFSHHVVCLSSVESDFTSEVTGNRMKRVCSWCKTIMGSVPSPGRPHNMITHGICDTCMVRIMLPLSETLMSFLESLEAPVLVVADDGTIRGANVQARSLLHKELPEIAGFTGGGRLRMRLCRPSGRLRPYDPLQRLHHPQHRDGYATDRHEPSEYAGIPDQMRCRQHHGNPLPHFHGESRRLCAAENRSGRRHPGSSRPGITSRQSRTIP